MTLDQLIELLQRGRQCEVGNTPVQVEDLDGRRCDIANIFVQLENPTVTGSPRVVMLIAERPQ